MSAGGPEVLTCAEKNAAAEDRAWEMLTSRLLAVAAERNALAKRVEALRAGLNRVLDASGPSETAEVVIDALATDDAAREVQS